MLHSLIMIAFVINIREFPHNYSISSFGASLALNKFTFQVMRGQMMEYISPRLPSAQYGKEVYVNNNLWSYST